MKKLFCLLLCIVAVNARWSLHYGAKQDKNDDSDLELDWWENGVFYQASEAAKACEVFCQVLV